MYLALFSVSAPQNSHAEISSHFYPLYSATALAQQLGSTKNFQCFFWKCCEILLSSLRNLKLALWIWHRDLYFLCSLENVTQTLNKATSILVNEAVVRKTLGHGLQLLFSTSWRVRRLRAYASPPGLPHRVRWGPSPAAACMQPPALEAGGVPTL